MFVDYTESPVGPYRELLFIPEAHRALRGHCLSIHKIYVSSQDSVVNGRRNWGIPKELAAFRVQAGPGGRETLSMSVAGRCAVQLTLRGLPLIAPFTLALVPGQMRTLCQTLDGLDFTITPRARGLCQPARVLTADVDNTLFPAFAAADVLVAARLRRVTLVFPKAAQRPVSARELPGSARGWS